MTDEERELLAILRDGRPEMRQAILGYFDVLLAGSCSLCCGTGSLYRTEQQASGWVAIFEDCPGCIPPR